MAVSALKGNVNTRPRIRRGRVDVAGCLVRPLAVALVVLVCELEESLDGPSGAAHFVGDGSARCRTHVFAAMGSCEPRHPRSIGHRNFAWAQVLGEQVVELTRHPVYLIGGLLEDVDRITP